MERLEINFGDRFGRLVIQAEAPARLQPCGDKKRQFYVKCDCGNTKIVSMSPLRNGDTKSCGCLNKEIAAKRLTKHGLSDSSEHLAWEAMKARCINPYNKAYKDYGGRGISVDKAWVNDFLAFYKHIGPKPTPNHSLDRINVNGNYEPGNVRWATAKEQRANQRKSAVIQKFSTEELEAELALRRINRSYN